VGLIAFKIRKFGNLVPNGLSFFKYTKHDATNLLEKSSGFILKIPLFIIPWNVVGYDVRVDGFLRGKKVVFWFFRFRMKKKDVERIFGIINLVDLIPIGKQIEVKSKKNDKGKVAWVNIKDSD